MANLAPSWRPKALQNRGRNPKKTMLKNDTFLTSIFKGFGRRFGLVFGRFFGPKMHSKSDSKKSARQAKSIGKTNTKSMSALLQQSIFRAKIDEKSHVFWDVDFELKKPLSQERRHRFRIGFSNTFCLSDTFLRFAVRMHFGSEKPTKNTSKMRVEPLKNRCQKRVVFQL